MKSLLLFAFTTFLFVQSHAMDDDDDKTHTTIHRASMHGSFVLLENEVSKNSSQINSLNKSGFSPLCYAVINGHVDLVKFLLKQPNIIVKRNEDNKEQDPMKWLLAHIEAKRASHYPFIHEKIQKLEEIKLLLEPYYQ